MHRFVALVNPVAGAGRAASLWSQVSRLLDPASHACIETTSREHALAASSEAAAEGSCVVAVGGDGLVRDVAAGVMAAGVVTATTESARPSMAVVPAGRGNDLARRLNLPNEPADIAEALMSSGDGTERAIDVLEVNGHVVLGNAYVGVDAVAARLINRFRWLPDVALYRGAGVAAVVRWRRTAFHLAYVDESGTPVDREIAAHDIVLANSGQYGHGLEIVPSAQIDDGWIDVLIVKHGSPLRVGAFLLAAQKGSHVRRDDVEVFRTRSITIEADRDVPFGADGDEVTGLPARIDLQPHAIFLVGFNPNRQLNRQVV